MNRSFASAVSSLHDCLRNFLESESRIHVTDVIKFRGASLNDNLTEDMVRISSQCLVEEIRLLRPTGVVLTSMTPSAIAKLKDQPRFEEIQGELLNHSRRKDVPFWKYAAFPEWQMALKRLVG